MFGPGFNSPQLHNPTNDHSPRLDIQLEARVVSVYLQSKHINKRLYNMKRSYSVVYHRPAGHTFTDQDVQYVWIHASEYANIFGEKRKNGALGDYVSISYQDKKIYRKVETTGHLGVGKNSIALSYNSLAELGLLKAPNENLGEAKLLQKVYVQPASTHQFNWNHPDRGERLNHRISSIALLVSSVSIIFGILSLIIL